MRLLHTSDWHLGRSFHGVGMLEHQAVVLDRLVQDVRSERVDVVVVSGDVYDRALPSVDTVRLLDDVLSRLVDTGARVLLTSGNHDSPDRLGFGGRLLERGGLHLRTRLSDLDRPVLLEDQHGPVALYGLPYLEPSLVAEPLGCGRTHEDVLRAAVTRVRADLARRPVGTRSVLAAHAFVVGGQPSDSERDISVGGVGSVPAATFDGVDYVALGHLHGRQQVDEQVRYSGSPLAYSFSEAAQHKGWWLVDLDADGVGRVLPMSAPVPRPLAVLRGTLDDVLGAPRYGEHEQAWCQVTLTDASRPRSAMERLRERFPHTLALQFDPQGAPVDERSYRQRVRGHEPLEVCCGFLEHVRGGSPVTATERTVLRGALDAARIVGDGDPAPGRQQGVA